MTHSSAFQYISKFLKKFLPAFYFAYQDESKAFRMDLFYRACYLNDTLERKVQVLMAPSARHIHIPWEYYTFKAKLPWNHKDSDIVQQFVNEIARHVQKKLPRFASVMDKDQQLTFLGKHFAIDRQTIRLEINSQAGGKTAGSKKLLLDCYRDILDLYWAIAHHVSIKTFGPNFEYTRIDPLIYRKWSYPYYPFRDCKVKGNFFELKGNRKVLETLSVILGDSYQLPKEGECLVPFILEIMGLKNNLGIDPCPDRSVPLLLRNLVLFSRSFKLASHL